MEETSCTSRTTKLSAFLLSASSRQTSASFFDSIGSKLAGPPAKIKRRFGGATARQGCIKLLDFSLSSIGWRRGLGRGGAFLLVSPLLGPPHSFFAGRG